MNSKPSKTFKIVKLSKDGFATKVGEVKIGKNCASCSDVMVHDEGTGLDESAMRSGVNVMKAKNGTRYDKRQKLNIYHFYECTCGWGTGRKYNVKTYNMLIRLHRKKCDGGEKSKEEQQEKWEKMYKTKR